MVAGDPDARGGQGARRAADHAGRLGAEDRAQAAVHPPAKWSELATRASGASVPIFLMVPQVKLPKRLDLVRDAERARETVPGLLVAAWV